MARKIILWAGFVVVALGSVVLGLAAWRVSAGIQYENAYAAHAAAEQKHGDADRQLQAARATARQVDERADVALQHPRMASLPALGALRDADARLAAASGSAQGSEPTSARPFAPPADIARYPWPWAVSAAAWDMTDEARVLNHAAAEDTQTSTSLNTLRETVQSAENAAYAALAEEGRGLLDQSPDATNRTRFALQDQIDAVKGRSYAKELIDAFVAAEDEVRASEQQMLEEAEDPDLATRHEIEDYARSISGGVPMDFEWAAVVAGYGSNYLSGTTQWTDRYDYALITLNFTIESAWTRSYGLFDAKALVTHEVGHAQMLREDCRALFERPEFDGDQEMWATAWAIGMGFDTDGSGIEAYGRPTDEQIATASQCR